MHVDVKPFCSHLESINIYEGTPRNVKKYYYRSTYYQGY
jgi:hypothetical protein